MVLMAICRVFDSFPKRIYSISSLAGHRSIESILKGLQFTIEHRDDEEFSRCTLDISDQTFEDLKTYFKEELLKSRDIFNYRFRQGDKNVRLLLD